MINFVKLTKYGIAKIQTKIKLKSLLILLQYFFISKSYACECIIQDPKELATNDQYAITKIKINYPSIIDLIGNFTKFRDKEVNYKITILENIKGTYNYKYINASTNYGNGSCGRKIMCGEVITFFFI